MRLYRFDCVQDVFGVKPDSNLVFASGFLGDPGKY